MTDYKPLLMKLGTAEDGTNFNLDLRETNGLLIVGRTGSGKTVLMNNVISELAKKSSPRECEITIIDPMGVDYGQWNGLPHIRWAICKIDQHLALHYLTWHCNEILERHSLLALKKLNSIEQFNEQAEYKMPYRLLLIDEYYDIMALCKNTGLGLDYFYHCIETMTKLGPAVGIYLVIGTQLMGSFAVTRRISEAFNTHISFQTRNKEDSELIIGIAGAEHLKSCGEVIIHKPGAFLEQFDVDYMPDEQIIELVKQLNEN